MTLNRYTGKLVFSEDGQASIYEGDGDDRMRKLSEAATAAAAGHAAAVLAKFQREAEEICRKLARTVGNVSADIDQLSKGMQQAAASSGASLRDYANQVARVCAACPDVTLASEAVAAVALIGYRQVALCPDAMLPALLLKSSLHLAPVSAATHIKWARPEDARPEAKLDAELGFCVLWSPLSRVLVCYCWPPPPVGGEVDCAVREHWGRLVLGG